MVQLQRLEGFYWVARTAGYARAARAFPYPITQPAVHQQVKKLEAEVGAELFERVGKDKMILTPAGERLYDHVRPFYEQLPGVLRSIRSGEYGGELRIDTAAILLRGLMPRWIQRMQKKHPGIHVHLKETLQASLEGLRRGDADLVVNHLHEVPRDVATQEVAVLRPFIVLPRDHRLARRKRLDLAAFGTDPFVAYTPGLFENELQMAALANEGVRPSQILSASNAEGILGFVEAGLGWSIVPSLEERGPRGRGVVVLPAHSIDREFPVVAAWRKDAAANPLLDLALESAPEPD